MFGRKRKAEIKKQTGVYSSETMNKALETAKEFLAAYKKEQAVQAHKAGSLMRVSHAKATLSTVFNDIRATVEGGGQIPNYANYIDSFQAGYTEKDQAIADAREARRLLREQKRALPRQQALPRQ